MDYLVDLVGFAIVVFVLYRYLWRGPGNLSGRIAARQDAIAAEIEQSRATRERLVDAAEKYRESIAGTQAEAAKVRAEAATEGEQILAALKTSAEEEYRRMTALNEARLAAERQSVVAGLRQEVGQRTLDLAAELVQSALTDPGRQRRVLDRFIADLEVDDVAKNASADRAVAQPAGRAG